jgi:hypothetical protein
VLSDTIRSTCLPVGIGRWSRGQIAGSHAGITDAARPDGALPPPGNDSEECLEKAEGLAAAVRLYAEVFEADPGGDSEVSHRFARTLLALEEFELAGLCQRSGSSGSRWIEKHHPSCPRMADGGAASGCPARSSGWGKLVRSTRRVRLRGALVGFAWVCGRKTA